MQCIEGKELQNRCVLIKMMLRLFFLALTSKISEFYGKMIASPLWHSPDMKLIKMISCSRGPVLEYFALRNSETIRRYLIMYSVKSVRPVTNEDEGRSPGEGETLPKGLLGTEKFSAVAFERTRLI